MILPNARARSIFLSALTGSRFTNTFAFAGTSRARKRKDLTQEFFTRVIEKGFLDRYDPAKSRLRTFMRICVDGMVANEAKAASAAEARRRCRAPLARFRFGRDGVGPRPAGAARNRVAGFDGRISSKRNGCAAFSRWRSTLCVLNANAAASNSIFGSFELYDLDDSERNRASYDDLAREFGIAVTDVTNHLAFARREFRRIALEKLREMCAERR